MKGLFRIFVMVLALGGCAGVWYWSRGEEPLPQYRTTEPVRGNLVAKITATGTIQPEDVIDVGAQVAGKIERLGADPSDPDRTIDYGSVVQEGTVLAQIDDSLYKTQMARAKASLARAEADVSQLEARVYQREREWNRIQALSAMGKANVAESTYDLTKADNQAAKAALEIGKAEVESATAMLEEAEINLNYATIQSPVNGVIIDRRVNVGQTVVASLNAPSLFLIAKDLKRLEIWAAVNEADIGRIHPKQQVTFTVDAFPGQTFQGEVVQTRLNATMTQNVVTYTVVVSTDNSAGQLLPYLTTNLSFEVGKRENVLMVPNAALRWKPKPNQIAPDLRAEKATPGEGKEESGDGESQGLVWTLSGRYVRPVPLKLGLSDDIMTEVLSGDLTEDSKLVVGEIQATDDQTASSSPFTPQFRPSKRP